MVIQNDSSRTLIVGRLPIYENIVACFKYYLICSLFVFTLLTTFIGVLFATSGGRYEFLMAVNSIFGNVTSNHILIPICVWLSTIVVFIIAMLCTSGDIRVEEVT